MAKMLDSLRCPFDNHPRTQRYHSIQTDAPATTIAEFSCASKLRKIIDQGRVNVTAIRSDVEKRKKKRY